MTTWKFAENLLYIRRQRVSQNGIQQYVPPKRWWTSTDDMASIFRVESGGKSLAIL
jgi:hypothetical protein